MEMTAEREDGWEGGGLGRPQLDPSVSKNKAGMRSFSRHQLRSQAVRTGMETAPEPRQGGRPPRPPCPLGRLPPTPRPQPYSTCLGFPTQLPAALDRPLWLQGAIPERPASSGDVVSPHPGPGWGAWRKLSPAPKGEAWAWSPGQPCRWVSTALARSCDPAVTQPADSREGPAGEGATGARPFSLPPSPAGGDPAPG